MAYETEEDAQFSVVESFHIKYISSVLFN